MSGKSFIKSASELRLRSIHPIVDKSNRCTLIYDLERTFVLPVPRELQPDLAASLGSSLFEDRLRDWLIQEDLLTPDRQESWAEVKPRLPAVTDVSFDMSGSCNLGCHYCFERDINSRIGKMSEETAMAALTFAFSRAGSAKKIALHFGSGEPLLRFDLLRKIVEEANRRVAVTGQQISYELTTNATIVTDEIARFLRVHPFNVRVSCDGPPEVHDLYRPRINGQSSYKLVKAGLDLLLKHLPERLTVNSVLASGTRLADLWTWAKETGIRHYHVIKVGAYSEDKMNLHLEELGVFRSDLQFICDDLFSDLEFGRTPIEYQPITKIVRRLMIPEPITRFCGVASSYLGIASNGKIYPCFRHLGLSQYELGDVWHNNLNDQKRADFLTIEAADVDNRPHCQTCWARYLCGGGCYADSTVYGPDKRKPQVQHCPFWRTEIEMAIRFYNRMLDKDPNYCFALFSGAGKKNQAIEIPNLSFLKPRNCS